jgi:hypothetical protein
VITLWPSALLEGLPFRSAGLEMGFMENLDKDCLLGASKMLPRVWSPMKRIAKRASWMTPLVLLCVLLLGSYLRVRSVTETVVVNPLRADAGHYFRYAYNFVYKNIYSGEVGNLEDLNSPVTPDSVRPPGYPFFLALFVDGLSFKSFVEKVVIFQVILSSLTIILSFLLFKTFLPSAWALGASLLVAMSPHLIIPNSFVLSETLFCLLVVMIGYVTSFFPLKRSLPLAILIGMLIGLASLVRPIVEYLPILLGLLLFIHFGRREGFRCWTALLAGFFLAFFPWILRNAITLGAFSDDTLLINFFHHGMYPDFTFEGIPESRGYPYLFDPRSPAISKDIPSVLNEIWARFQERPWEQLKWCLIGKPVAFWSWDDVQGIGDAFIYPVVRSPYFSAAPFQWTHFFMFVIHWPLIILAGLASLLVWFCSLGETHSQKSLFVTRFISLVLISYTLIHMVGAPIQRYSFPLRPYLYGMAVFLVYFLWQTLRTRLQSYKITRQAYDQNRPSAHPATTPEEIIS